eukprot:scaffold1555_cov173-Amphora_coffeaeformis.AAC.13
MWTRRVPDSVDMVCRSSPEIRSVRPTFEGKRDKPSVHTDSNQGSSPLLRNRSGTPWSSYRALTPKRVPSEVRSNSSNNSSKYHRVCQ